MSALGYYCGNDRPIESQRIVAAWNTMVTARVGLAIGLCLIVLQPVLATEKTDPRPNIVFLMTDDQCFYSLGCYGVSDVQTPNLDQLATDGVAFDKYYVTTAICMASRATVMTGLVEYRTGCNFSHGPLLREHWSRSYPIQLGKTGYLTAFAGKFGFEVADSPRGAGSMPSDDFDRWAGGPGQTSYKTADNPALAKYAKQFPHSTLAYGAFGSDFIRDAAKQNRPFCLSISFKSPHRPATPDPRFDAVYAGSVFAEPANFGRRNGKHFSPQSRQGRQYRRFVTWHYNDDYNGVMATYYQQVYGVDVAVGMIRRALEESGAAKNTVIIFTSDNGFMCGSHGYGSKVLPYEEASRVPLIIVDCRNAEKLVGRRCDALCGNVDIAPTILALAGIDASDDLDGKSLLPLMTDPAASIHESLPLMNVWGPAAVHSLAVVTKDWKYIYWPYCERDFVPCEELYNTASDPLELKELSHNHRYANALQRMRALYDREVDLWKKLAVNYHGYQRFGTIFDRRLPSTN
jgi:arylsulfatase A-like enzyme